MNRRLILMWLLLMSLMIGAAAAREFDQDRHFWEASAFFCPTTGQPFPSKELLGNPADCDDGDMTLFNGLLCASGDERGCSAVALAQGPDGRWWRSPRRIGWEAPEHDVSFSPDQSLGVLLYVMEHRDSDRFSRWLNWLENNRACMIELADHCLQRGWLRFCRDDPDKRCTLRPADCLRLELVGSAIGVDGRLCQRILAELRLENQMIMPLEDWILSSALVNEPGYPMHLVGVSILLARKAGPNSPKLALAAEALALRAPDNPLFAYLASGATEAVKASLRSNCPSKDRPSSNRSQWTWERVAKPESWRDSMYWECVFLSRMLDQPEN